MTEPTTTERMDTLRAEAARKRANFVRARRRYTISLAILLAATLVVIIIASIYIEQGGPWWVTTASAIAVFLFVAMADRDMHMRAETSDIIDTIDGVNDALDVAQAVFETTTVAEPHKPTNYPVPEHNHD